MLEINMLDIAVGVFLLFFLAQGLARGLTREVSGVVGIVGGLALARRFQDKVQPSMEPLFNDPNTAAVASFALIFVFVLILVALAGAVLRRFMDITMTLWLDRLLGAVAGLAKGLLLASVLFFLLQGFFPDLALIKNARATPFFNSMIDYLRYFLPAAFTYKLPSFHL